MNGSDADEVMRAGNAPEDWVAASIVWIESKKGSDGKLIKEVVYERHDEPDLFREIKFAEDALYVGAERGDKVFIQPSAPAIRKIINAD